MQDQVARSGTQRRLALWCGLALACVGAGLFWFVRKSHAAPSFEGANVVVVMIDTLRADRLGLHPRGQATSPFIDELAERSVNFENATSTAPQTVPSVLSLLSSAYPSRHGNHYFHKTSSFRLPERKTLPQVPDELPLMGELFQARGYRTGAVVTNPWLQAKWGFDRGFDQYEFINRARGPVVNETGLRMIDGWNRQRPFLLYLHYMDVHFPRLPLDPFKEVFTAGLPGKNVYGNHGFPDLTDEDRIYSIAAYDACVRSMDEVLRELMQALEERGLDDSTLVVVVSDHGDEFGEHGGLGHGRTLYQEMLDVPLMFVHPKLEGHARRITEQVSLVDVLPTLVELTGGKVPQELMGRSLVGWILPGEPPPHPTPSPLIAELGFVKMIRDGDRKLIWFQDKDSMEAYDLGEDPGELRPIPQDLAWIANLRTRLRDVLDQTQPVATTQPPVEAELDNSELRKSLEALGYGR
jgi:arylsulfatase A-like enzyme